MQFVFVEFQARGDRNILKLTAKIHDLILHICKIILCILKNHTTFAPYDFTYMTFEK